MIVCQYLTNLLFENLFGICQRILLVYQYGLRLTLCSKLTHVIPANTNSLPRAALIPASHGALEQRQKPHTAFSIICLEQGPKFCSRSSPKSTVQVIRISHLPLQVCLKLSLNTPPRNYKFIGSLYSKSTH